MQLLVRMSIIPRAEQEKLVLQCEQSYGRLIRLYNQSLSQEEFYARARALAEDIGYSVEQGHFAKDLGEYLYEMSESILAIVPEVELQEVCELA